MKRVKSNIWNLFFILTAISTVGFLSVLYFDYKHLTKKIEFELETNVQLLANSIAYKLAEEELLLTSMGKELLDEKKVHLKNRDTLMKLLRNTLF